MNAILADTRTFNIGDFLQFNCVEKILENKFKCKVYPIHLKRSYDDINLDDYDIVVFYGSILSHDSYPNELKLASDLDTIKQKFMSLGCGYYGLSDMVATATPDTLRFLYKLSEISAINCRGPFSEAFCTHNKIESKIFGDSTYQGINNVRRFKVNDIKKIALSTPIQDYISMNQFLGISDIIEKCLPNSEIVISSHQGPTIRSKSLKDIRPKFTEKFFENDLASYIKFYDDMDLHIGFRLHAHLYCMARGIPSIIITTDSRGIDSPLTNIGNRIMYGNNNWLDHLEYFLRFSLSCDFVNYLKLDYEINNLRILQNSRIDELYDIYNH